MKNAIGSLTSLLILLICVVGCGSRNRSVDTGRSIKTATSPTIKIQSEPKGKTGVYQQDFRILPTLKVDGKPSEAKHGFTLFSMASYSGKKPRCETQSIVFSVSHDTTDINDWRYPSATAVKVVIDGATHDMKVSSQLPYKMPEMANYMKDPQPSEAILVSPGCELYQKLAKATLVELQIGNGSFSLPPEGVANFREFAKAIGY